jgi:hypothetical protein
MVRYFAHYWGAACLLLPYFIWPNNYNDIRICRNFLAFALIIGSVMIFGQKRIHFKSSWPFLALLALSWINHHNFYLIGVIEQTVIFSGFMLLAIHLISNLEPEDHPILFNYLRISALVQCVFMFINIFGVNIYNPRVPVHDLVGSFGQHTLAAAYLAILVPFFFTKRWIFFTPILVTFIYLSGSAMSMLACIAGIVFACIYKMYHRKSAICATGAALLLFYVFYSLFLSTEKYFEDNERFKVWWNSYYIYTQYFDDGSVLVGKGLGYFYHYFMTTCKTCKQYFTYAHNELLELLWAFGLVGAFLVGAMGYQLVWIKEQKYTLMFMTAIAIAIANSMGNFTFHMSPAALVIVICYACLINQDLHEKGEKTWQLQLQEF